jgi:hypothetical protein
MEHAEDTSFGPNQTAASRAGTLRIKTCDMATSVWPTNATTNMSGDADATLIHDPHAVPRAPSVADKRSPCNERKGVTD